MSNVERRMVSWAWLLLGWALALARPALASDQARAEQLVRQAITLQEAGRHEQALPVFDQSLASFDHPFTRFFKARSLVALERWEAGRELYRTLLAALETLGPKNHGEVKENLARCERMLEETVVLVRTPPLKGARVLLDGRHQGAAPLTLRLRRGRYALSVEKEGYAPAARQLEIAGQAREVVDLSLTPAPSPVEPGGALSAAGPSATVRARRLWAWTSLGLGGAAAVTGAGFLGNWASYQGEALDDGQCLAGEGADLAIGGTLLGVGLGGAGVGLYLLLSEVEEAPPVSAGVAPWPGQGAIFSFQGRW